MADDIFQQLHTELTKELLKRVREGTATAADLNVARQWLINNQVAADPSINPGLKALGAELKDLPFDNPDPTFKAH